MRLAEKVGIGAAHRWALAAHKVQPERVEARDLYCRDDGQQPPIGRGSRLEPAVAQFCHERVLINSDTVPAQGDGAGQRVMKEVDDIVRQTGTRSPVGFLILIFGSAGAGLARQKSTERSGVLQRRQESTLERRLSCYFQRDERWAAVVPGRSAPRPRRTGYSSL